MEGKIVVIMNERHIEDRSWMANGVAEAFDMVKWLRDNHITAERHTEESWNKLQEKEKAERE